MGSQATSAPALSIAPGSTATTTVSGVLDNGCTKQQHAAYITIAGTLTAGLVTLQTSLDNVNWATVAGERRGRSPPPPGSPRAPECGC